MRHIDTTDRLLQILKSTLRKQRLVYFGAGLLVTGAVMAALWLVLSLVASVAVLPVWLKLSLLAMSGLVTIVMFGRFAVARMFAGSVEAVAVRLEQQFPDLKGRLIAAVQFATMTSTPGYSPVLIEQTHREALDRASQIDFDRAVASTPIVRSARLFAAAALAVVAVAVIVPGLFSRAVEVYSSPTQVVAPPLGYRLVAFPGATEWVKYRDIEIGASLFGSGLPRQATIHYRPVGGSWQTAEIDITTQRLLSQAGGDSVRFGTTLRQINKSFDYYVEAGRVKTDVMQVNVVDRPRVNDIKLSIFYPAYTKLAPTVIRENNGSFSAVVGSRVNIDIETSLPVVRADLVFEDSSRTPMTVDGRSGTLAVVVDTSQSYFIELTDHLGEHNPDPIEYYITAVPDEYPVAEVISPGVNVNLGDDMVLPLAVRIFDDFGFSSLVMKYVVVSQGQASTENVVVLHYSDRITTEGEVEFSWDMDQLDLYPGDYVSYFFEVADNDRISGPKVGQSRTFIARVPSLEEIVADVENRGQKRLDETQDVLRSGKDLAERLQKMARKLESQGQQFQEMDWQQQKEMESILEKNEEIVKDVERLAEEMNRSMEELNEKALLSREILEKMAEIQKLYEDVATPEMKEAQKRLMEALKEMDPNELQKAMEDFQLSQEDMMERLDRTLSLLKRMQVEQKMESMTRQLEELVERQEAMNNKTDSSQSPALPPLADEEEKIEKDLAGLQKDAKDLEELAREAEMDQMEQVQKFKDALEKTEAPEHMQEMQQSLEQQQQQDASKHGKKALSELTEMLDEMQQQMMAMKGADQEAVERAFRDAIDDATSLSQTQEDILRQAADMGSASMMLRELATGQQDMIQSTVGLQKRIDELGRLSPFVAAETQQLVVQASEYMQMAMRGLDATRRSAANEHQREAMVNLNKAALRLMESMQQQKQCNKGAACDKPTQALQELSQRQNELNKRTQKECQNPGLSQKPTPGQGQGSEGREELKRLAGEQQSIRKSLEDLNREFGGSRSILGRLDDIAREMQDVEEMMQEGQAGSDITERQLRIFSRMLEASRSLYRKDFTEQRQSESAGDATVFAPPELSPDLLDENVKLEDRLRQYLGDSYPKQYEEQIKAYFKALLETERQRLKDQAQPTR